MPATPSPQSKASVGKPSGETIERVRPNVLPRGVFVAGRQSFEAEIRIGDVGSQSAKGLLFDELPLERNGWNFVTSRISLVFRCRDYSLWKLERG